MSESPKSENYRRNTVPNNPCIQLESLVQDAEVHRHGQKTAEVQRYLDTHPELPQYTRNLTHEIQDKMLFHLANGEILARVLSVLINRTWALSALRTCCVEVCP